MILPDSTGGIQAGAKRKLPGLCSTPAQTWTSGVQQDGPKLSLIPQPQKSFGGSIRRAASTEPLLQTSVDNHDNSSASVTMLSRGLRIGRALQTPLRQRTYAPTIAAARRSVTTDAASSHVEKGAVPKVSSL